MNKSKALYVPGSTKVHDGIRGGITIHGKETITEFLGKHPTAIIVSWEDALAMIFKEHEARVSLLNELTQKTPKKTLLTF